MVAAADGGRGCLAPPCEHRSSMRVGGRGPVAAPHKRSVTGTESLTFTCCETVFGFFFTIKSLITNTNLHLLAVQSLEALQPHWEQEGPGLLPATGLPCSPAPGHSEPPGKAGTRSRVGGATSPTVTCELTNRI